MSLCWIKECGVDQSVSHSLYAYFRCGVDAYDLYVVTSEASHRFRSADRHPVVVGVYEIDLGIQLQKGVGHPDCVLFVPVGCHACKQSPAERFEFACKALMASVGWCGSFQTADLYGLGVVAGQIPGVCGRRASYALVIHADTCGICVVVDVSVKDDHRHSIPVYFPDHRSEGSRLVGRDYYYVKTVADKISDVIDLLCTVVVGRSDLHLGVLMKHYLAIDLIVQFHSPVILAALRHTDSIGLDLSAARQDKQQSQPTV